MTSLLDTLNLQKAELEAEVERREKRINSGRSWFPERIASTIETKKVQLKMLEQVIEQLEGIVKAIQKEQDDDIDAHTFDSHENYYLEGKAQAYGKTLDLLGKAGEQKA